MEKGRLGGTRRRCGTHRAGRKSAFHFEAAETHNRATWNLAATHTSLSRLTGHQTRPTPMSNTKWVRKAAENRELQPPYFTPTHAKSRARGSKVACGGWASQTHQHLHSIIGK